MNILSFLRCALASAGLLLVLSGCSPKSGSSLTAAQRAQAQQEQIGKLPPQAQALARQMQAEKARTDALRSQDAARRPGTP